MNMLISGINHRRARETHRTAIVPMLSLMGEEYRVLMSVAASAVLVRRCPSVDASARAKVDRRVRMRVTVMQYVMPELARVLKCLGGKGLKCAFPTSRYPK